MGFGQGQTLTEATRGRWGRNVRRWRRPRPPARGGAQVVFGNKTGDVDSGHHARVLTIRDMTIQNGQAFTQQDVDAATKVAVLGKTVVDNLFNGEDRWARSSA